MRRRSHDFPDVTNFPSTVLKDAAKYYASDARKKENHVGYNIIEDFAIKYNMTCTNAAILVSAAKFHYNMQKKGLA